MKTLKEIMDENNLWLNFWEVKSDNPKAPVINIVLKDKTTGEAVKYPVWRDDKDKLYAGKGEAIESQTKPKADYKTTPAVSGADSMPNDDIPF